MPDENTTERPNIVFFMCDQLSARWLEEPASDAIPTPNVDRLRRMGASFRNCITSNPLCCPARATLATGLTTRGHGVLQNGYALDPEIPTFMQTLQANGWRTGCFGKLHFHPHFAGVHPDYTPYGFDETKITEDPRGGDWLDWILSEHPEHADGALAQIWCTAIPEFAAYGPEKTNLAERINRVRAEMEWATPEFPDNSPWNSTLHIPAELSQTEWITGHALDFFSRCGDAPFMAHVSYVQPHGPFYPPAECMANVDVDAIPEPAPVEWLEDPLAPRCFRESQRTAAGIPDDWRTRRRYYFADITHLDAQLGRVIDALEESGRLEKTYIVLIADHGEMLHDHAFTGKSFMHYDACIRVPCVVAGPGLGQGLERDEPVQLEDMFRTVLDMTGLPEPTPPATGPYLKEEPVALAGRSLLPLCRGETVDDWREAAYSESYNNIANVSTDYWTRTVRSREWRYSYWPDGAGEQLFRISEDPQEQRNLAGDPAFAEVRREMRDRLLDLVILQDWPHSPRDIWAHGVH